jgi:hypothetical protein
MCDYSLMGVPNRLATEGEELIVHRFATGSIGLTASAAKRGFWQTIKELFGDGESQQAVAVCVPPGARLLLRDIPIDLQRRCGASRVEEVTFTQLSAKENTHRDAIRLDNGTEILLQQLREGQRVRILQFFTPDGEVAPVLHMVGVR